MEQVEMPFLPPPERRVTDSKFRSRKFLITAGIAISGCVVFLIGALHGHPPEFAEFAIFAGACIGAYSWADNNDPHKLSANARA